MKITDKQRPDWLDRQSRKPVVSFHHPEAIDAQILSATKPKTKNQPQ